MASEDRLGGLVEECDRRTAVSCAVATATVASPVDGLVNGSSVTKVRVSAIEVTAGVDS